MKVIFLDIDGVLNCADTIKTMESRVHDRWASMIDAGMVARLNTILDRTGAVCVLSSSWRILLTPEQMEDVLRVRGFTGSIIDRTGSCGSRGKEIRDWLLEHNTERFVILDDEPYDMNGEIYGWPMRDSLVQTSFERGLEETHVEEAVRRLNMTAEEEAEKMYARDAATIRKLDEANALIDGLEDSDERGR